MMDTVLTHMTLPCESNHCHRGTHLITKYILLPTRTTMQIQTGYEIKPCAADVMALFKLNVMVSDIFFEVPLCIISLPLCLPQFDNHVMI